MLVALFQVCVSGVCATVYRVKQREREMWTPIGRSPASLRPLARPQERTIWNGWEIENAGMVKWWNRSVICPQSFSHFTDFQMREKGWWNWPVRLHSCLIASCTRTHSVPSLVSLIPHLLMSSLIDIMGDYANSAACADTLLLLLTLQCLLYQNMCIILYSYVRHYNLVLVPCCQESIFSRVM